MWQIEVYKRQNLLFFNSPKWVIGQPMKSVLTPTNSIARFNFPDFLELIWKFALIDEEHKTPLLFLLCFQNIFVNSEYILAYHPPPVSLSSKEGRNLFGICPGLRLCLLLSEKSSIVTPEHSLLAIPPFALAWIPIAVVAKRKAVVHGNFIEHKCQSSADFTNRKKPLLFNSFRHSHFT